MPGKTKAKGGRPCVVLPPPTSKKLLSKRAQIEKLLRETAAPKPSSPLSKAKRPQQPPGKQAISVCFIMFTEPLPILIPFNVENHSRSL